jgi:aspartate racemase
MVKIKKHRTCGILGGMGPYASAQFYKNILDNTETKKDWDHIHILLDSNVYIPSRTRAVIYNEASPVPGMIKSINNLAAIGAHFAVVPCNSAHYFYKEVQQYINIKWLNMPELIAAKILENGYRKPLVVGGFITTAKKVYSEFIPDVFYLDSSGNRFFESIVEEVKHTSKITEKSAQDILDILSLNENSFDCIIPACTEFTLITDIFEKSGKPVFDSNLIYAQETIKYAKEKVLCQ